MVDARWGSDEIAAPRTSDDAVFHTPCFVAQWHPFSFLFLEGFPFNRNQPKKDALFPMATGHLSHTWPMVFKATWPNPAELASGFFGSSL